jgi:hypothetical protein
MTHTATHSVPEQGKFRRALAAVWTFLQSLESTSFDYTLDRIERLEREMGRLKEEMRQSRDPGTVDAHNAGAAAREQWLGRRRIPGSSHRPRATESI